MDLDQNVICCAFPLGLPRLLSQAQFEIRIHHDLRHLEVCKAYRLSFQPQPGSYDDE